MRTLFRIIAISIVVVGLGYLLQPVAVSSGVHSFIGAKFDGKKPLKLKGEEGKPADTILIPKDGKWHYIMVYATCQKDADKITVKLYDADGDNKADFLDTAQRSCYAEDTGMRLPYVTPHLQIKCVYDESKGRYIVTGKDGSSGEAEAELYVLDGEQRVPNTWWDAKC